MGSRIRENPTRIFDCYVEVGPPTFPNQVPSIVKKFPENYVDEELLKSIPQFAFPCEVNNNGVQHFSFVLTSHDSKWTFGFCRQAPVSSSPVCCMVLLSSLPWHEIFYRLLNQLAELAHKSEGELQLAFLTALYQAKVPEPGLELRFSYHTKLLELQCPDHNKLPSIPENRNLTEYFNAVDPYNMMVIFASMLHERRILLSSKRLSRLSACVQAANALIYPMAWQHIFIPVLPTHLLDYLSAPMPFLIGVPASTLATIRRAELGDLVILDCDTNSLESPFDDLNNLPSEVVIYLKKFFKSPPSQVVGDGVARAFLKALVWLIGGYWSALSLRSGEKITFNPETFVQSRPLTLQPFLHKMLQLQIFQQFIEGRLRQLNAGRGLSDEFECEVSLYEGRRNTWFRAQYREWLSTMKKESGAFFKSVKSKVKDTSKQAYRDLRSKLQDLQHKDLSRRATHPFDLHPSHRPKVISYMKPSLLDSSTGSETSLDEMAPQDDYRPTPPPRRLKDCASEDLIQLSNGESSSCLVAPPPANNNSKNPFAANPLTHTHSFPPHNPFSNWQTFQ